jgi:hypothetical protein
MDCSSLTAIAIPAGVTEIGGSAFNGCANLAAVTFGENSALQKLDQWAFRSCVSLQGIVLPAGVTEIGSEAFNYCASLETIELPAALKNSTYGLFANDQIFAKCTSLKAINVHPDNADFMSMDGIVFSKDGTTLLYCPEAVDMTEYAIPASATVIDKGAFWFNRTLQKVVIHENVTTIGENAFLYCAALTHVDIQDGENGSALISLGTGAFLREAAQYTDQYLDVYLPRSLPADILDGDDDDPYDGLWFLFVDPDHGESAATVRLSVYYGSDVAAWAKDIGVPYYFRPDSIELQANPPDLMYKYIPYMFTPKTTIPTNEDLYFWLEDAGGNPLNLPAGLTLYDGITLPADAPADIRPGVIYGAPLEYTAFETGVDFVM